MINIHSGDLNRQVTILKKLVTRNAYGEETIIYPAIATVWANIQIGTGREFFAAQKINSELKGIIKIRFRRGLLPDMRITYNNITYELVSPPIDINDKREFLRLEVKEVLDNGQQ